MAFAVLRVTGMNATAYGLTARMLTEQNARLDTVTDNLANSATPGYRRGRVSAPSFDQILLERSGNPRVSIDTTSGALKTTGNPLDFAINGAGFFVLEKDGKEYFTRNGQFVISPEGHLATPGGLTVQGEGGALAIPPDADLSKMTVASDGTVHVDGQSIGKLKIVDFENPGVLRRAGTSLLSAPANAATRTPEESSVVNHSLESSNTSVFEEMAELMTGFRSFDMCQRILRAQDNAESSMIRQYSA